MENRSVLAKVLGVFFFSLFVLVPKSDLAWGDDTTHAYLTNLSFQIAGKYGTTFTKNDVFKAVRGAIAEDDAPRWMHHFYDPTTSKGLTISRTEWLSAKKWVNEQTNEWNWDRAVYEYAWGDKTKALEALGHTLHLIQDMAVPEHTRNEAHPAGSTLESWAATTGAETDISGAIPEYVSTLDEAFDETALYSNNNFYSPNTIGVTSLPRIVEKTNIGGLTFGTGLIAGKRYPIVYITRQFGSKNETYSLSDSNNLINKTYWSLLSRKAVEEGAGVIKLFLRAVEKEKKTGDLKNRYAKVKVNGLKIVDDSVASTPSIWHAASLFGGASLATAVPQVPASTPTPSQGGGSAGATSAEQPSEPSIPVPSTPSVPAYTPPVQDVAPSAPVLTAPSTPAPSAPVYDGTPLFSYSPIPGYGGGGGGGSTPVATETTSTPSSDPEPEPEPVPDTTPPVVTISVPECSASISPSACVFRSAQSVTIMWSSSDSDLSEYELSLDGVATATTSTSTVFLVSADTEHTFSVRAKDTVGNWSLTQSVLVSAVSAPLVLNEIYWAGTASTTEYIEIYNTASTTIDLGGFVLHSVTDNSPFVRLSGTIPSHGYFTIAPSATVRGMPVGQVSSFGAGLSSSGEQIRISYASGSATTTIDDTFTVASCSAWCSQGSTSASMEKYRPTLAASLKTNWKTAMSDIGGTVDGIAGTPNATNTVSHLPSIYSTVSSDLHLTKDWSPYYPSNSTFAIQSGATLSVDPGVIFRVLPGTRFEVSGKLEARGTADNPVVFTSLYDDTSGGDFDGDGGSRQPTGKSWRSLYVGTGGELLLENSIIKYAGNGSQYNGSLELLNGRGATITDSQIIATSTYGAYISRTPAHITGSYFSGNSAGSALYNEGTYGVYEGNRFEEAKYGAELNSWNGQFLDNIFKNIKNVPIKFFYPGGESSLARNTVDGAGWHGVYLDGYTYSATTTLSANPGLPYLLYSQFAVRSGTSLVLNPGVSVKYWGSDAWLDVTGRLEVRGTASEPVNFTNADDDTDGVDATNNGSTTPMTATNNRIRFRSTSTSVIENAIIKYLKYGVEYMTTAPIDLSNVHFERNSLAVFGYSSSTVHRAENVTFQNNTSDMSPTNLW